MFYIGEGAQDRAAQAEDADSLGEFYRTCTTDDLSVGYTQMVALSRVARAHASAMLEVLVRREAYLADGATSPAAWVAMAESVSICTARDTVEVSMALAGLPHIAGAALRGELSEDQLSALVRIASPETDEHWAAQGPACSAAELARLARSASRVDNESADATHAKRSFRWWDEVGADGLTTAMRLSGRLTPDAGALVAKALSSMAESAPAMPDGTYEAFAARAADALVELASTHLASQEDASRSVRSTVVIHVDANALRRDGEGFIQCDAGVPLAPEVARRLACDARLQVVLDDALGTPVGVGRTSRKTPAWLERLVDRRDGSACRFPGCARTRGLQRHHMIHWPDGGPTDMGNLITLCSRHHHLVHDNGWSIEGDPNIPGDLRIRRPDGGQMTPRPVTLRRDLSDRLLCGAGP
ncbi:MAG: DUF222 domain-containing protein [Acidimicrobiales bacterium]